MEVRQAAGRAGVAGLPIGFRFRPTDEELVLHYLRRKAFAFPLPADIIPVVDLARYDPWDLPGDGEAERYLFYLPGRRSRGRTAGSGVWKAAGKETAVVASRCKRQVGAKRTLVFHLGSGARTDWVMHEYRLLSCLDGCARKDAHAPHMSCNVAGARDWVVCRVFKKSLPNHRRGSRCSYVRDTARRRGVGERPSSPASSCVTEASDNDEEEEEERNSSSSSSVASNRP